MINGFERLRVEEGFIKMNSRRVILVIQGLLAFFLSIINFIQYDNLIGCFLWALFGISSVFFAFRTPVLRDNTATLNKYIYFGLGIIGGLATGFILGKLYGMQVKTNREDIIQRTLIEDKIHETHVLVAKNPIPAGTKLTSELITTVIVSEKILGSAISAQDINMVLGEKVIFDINRGSLIRWADIENNTLRDLSDLGGRLNVDDLISEPSRAASEIR